MDPEEAKIYQKGTFKIMRSRYPPSIRKRIAILGGSTTHDVKDMLELFLLNYGIVPEFYESEYNQYYQDIMFDNPELAAFHPDLIYIHDQHPKHHGMAIL